MKIKFSNHAQLECNRRQVSQEVVAQVLENPDQAVLVEHDRTAFQSLVKFPNGKTYLVRVIAEQKSSELVVVTVYRTSKIAMYWREK